MLTKKFMDDIYESKERVEKLKISIENEREQTKKLIKELHENISEPFSEEQIEYLQTSLQHMIDAEKSLDRYIFYISESIGDSVNREDSDDIDDMYRLDI